MTLAEREVEGLAPVPRRVELVAGRPRDPDVVDDHGAARPGLGTRALGHVFDQEVLGRWALGHGDVGLDLLGHRPTLPPSPPEAVGEAWPPGPVGPSPGVADEGADERIRTSTPEGTGT